MLAAIGVACTPSQVIRDGRERVDLPYPVAAKILSGDIPHKTDVDGVVLDIRDARALSAAVDDLLTRISARLPDARIDGVLVQPMQRGIGEVIVGYRYDREVGPIVMLGVGGIPAELCEGHALRLAPVSPETAMEMITEVPGLALLRGYRARPRGDLEALAQVVHLLSLLACSDAPAVLEAEINPLIVRTDGVVAVDALVRIDDA
jgi:succinyl-CoA synthetase beta subunit